MKSQAVFHEAEFPAPDTSRAGISLREKFLAAALLGLGIVLRFLYIWHYRIDSDEPQHLHVVWGWTQGLLPYRDVFDNHAPLFQALFAPVFHWLGTRADIVLPMRAAELPIWALTIFCVWKISAALYSPRVALWTATLAALCPPFYLSSIEFRPDQLWTLCWMLILLVLATGRMTPWRTLLAGLLAGFSFCVSMKTTLLLLTLVQSGVGAVLIRRAAGGLPLRWTRLATCAASGLLGMPIFPALVVLYFWRHGAMAEMKYCVIGHNVLSGSAQHFLGLHAIGHWLLRLCPIAAGGYLITRLPMSIGTRTRTGFLFLAGWIYYATLISFWPIITAEDYLPFYPAAMLSVGPALLWLADRGLRNLPISGGALFAAAELVGTLILASPFQDGTVDKVGLVGDALKLTAPDDYVMDGKGEAIYRRRAFPWVFEAMTFRRMKQGLIANDAIERMIQTRTPLVTLLRMPKNVREFIKTNYVPIAFRWFVAGKTIRAGNDRARKPVSFEVAVPQRYTLVTPSGIPRGDLDGLPLAGPRELAAGPHTFVPDEAHGSIVLIWAAALERGYSPFAQIKRDYRTEQD